MAPRETENNAHAKFWGDKQRALWYVMVFSGVVNCDHRTSSPTKLSHQIKKSRLSNIIWVNVELITINVATKN